MSLAPLTRTDFATPLGVVPLWHEAGALEATRTAILFINRPLAPARSAIALQAAVAGDADIFWMQMPGDVAPHLSQTSLAAFAEAVADLLDLAFGQRRVILGGQGMGATLALAVRSPRVARVVAVEPELEPATAWPILPTLRKLARERPAVRPLIKALYGVSPDGSDAPSNLAVLDGLSAPTDVLVGEEPLLPQRAVKRPPSLVSQPLRDRFAASAAIRLHVAPRAGTALLDDSPDQVGLLLREALTAIRAEHSFHPALLIWAPLTARRVAYLGQDAGAFAAQYGRRNPSADIAAAASIEGLAAGPFDLLILGDLDRTEPTALAPLLAAGGLLIAVAGEDAAALLQAANLRLDVSHPARSHLDRYNDIAPEPSDPADRRIVLARRAADPAPPRTDVRFVSYAQRMMDIRTRLPAQALRSEPTLNMAYQHAPIGKLHMDSVFVLQRPAEQKLALWRPFLKAVFEHRAIIVLEYDDHPQVIADALQKTLTADDWAVFGNAHAIQTSTPELAAVFGHYNSEIQVFANAAFDLPPFPDRPPSPKIFYGALARGGFPAEVARSLAGVLAAHPDASFDVVGDQGVFDALRTPNKRFHPLMPYEAYLALMGTCSILLTPLEGAHYETKSDTKFLDAASRGLATIASPAAYGATVRHGDNGLIANGLSDWAPLLSRLLADPQATRDMAHRAFAYVRDERMFAHQIAQRRDWYASLIARREALNAAVISRVPGLADLIGG